MDKRRLRRVWERFTEGKEFMLNPNKEIVDKVIEGVLTNEKNYGLKYCPCQLQSKDFEKDLELICPCNFFIQKTYTEEGRCWCGLFVKRK